MRRWTWVAVGAVLAAGFVAASGCDSESEPATPTGTGGAAGGGGTAAAGGEGGQAAAGGQGGEGGDPCAGHCTNGVFDCGETDLDCGGECNACPEEEVWAETAQEALFPTVAATATKVVVAWSVVGEVGVFYRCKDASGWADAAVLTTSNAYTNFPRAQADGQGRIHLVTTRGAGGAILYAVLSNAADCAGSSWSQVDTLVDLGDGGGRYPQVAVDDNDAPHVVWHDRDYTNVYYSHAMSGSWSAPVNVTNTQWDSRYPDVAVLGTTPHVVFEQDDDTYTNTRPRYTYWTGSDFAAAESLSEERHSWPQVVVDDSGRVHSLFTTRSGDEVRYFRRDGSTWQAPVKLNEDETDWSWTSLALDDSGGLHAVFHELVSGLGQTHYAVGDAATGTWQPPRQVSTEPTLDNWVATVAVDPHGHTHIAWLQPLGAGEAVVRYRKVTYDDLAP